MYIYIIYIYDSNYERIGDIVWIQFILIVDCVKHLQASIYIDSVQLLCRFIAEIRKDICSLIQVHCPQNPGCSHRRSAGILFGMLQHSPIMILPFIATIYPHQLVRHIRRTREFFILKKKWSILNSQKLNNEWIYIRIYIYMNVYS